MLADNENPFAALDNSNGKAKKSGSTGSKTEKRKKQKVKKQAAEDGRTLTSDEAAAALEAQTGINPDDQSEQSRFDASTWLGWGANHLDRLFWAVVYNKARDFGWGWASETDIGWQAKDTSNTYTQLGAQWLYGTLAMGGVFILKCAVYKCLNKKMSYYDDFKSILAASAAIPGWDLAANAAIAYYQKNGQTLLEAGYNAWWAPGLAEGPTQFLVPEFCDAMVDLFTTKKKYHAFLSNPIRAIAGFLGNVVLNGTLGSIPGDVWQIVYNRCIEKNYDPKLTGALIALAVGACNILFGIANEEINKKATKIADKCLGKVVAPESDDETDDDDLESGESAETLGDGQPARRTSSVAREQPMQPRGSTSSAGTVVRQPLAPPMAAGFVQPQPTAALLPTVPVGSTTTGGGYGATAAALSRSPVLSPSGVTVASAGATGAASGAAANDGTVILPDGASDRGAIQDSGYVVAVPAVEIRPVL